MNPGPQEDLGPLIGAFNPTGLLGRAELISQLPVSKHQTIWAVSESHLTQEGKLKFAKELAIQKSGLRMQLGTAVPNRSTTISAIGGKHRGVGFLTDASNRALMTDWDAATHNLNRIHTACFHIRGRAILGATVYGYAAQPDTTATRQLTESLCQKVSDVIVHNQHGMRFIAGDFNQVDGALPSMVSWIAAGWVNVQQWAKDHFDQEIQCTCKGVTTRDHIFVSPELARYLKQVHVEHDWFPDHSVLWAEFTPLDAPPMVPMWRSPKPLPWKTISNLPVQEQPMSFDGTSTQKYAQICNHLESRFQAQLAAKNEKLPNNYYGRGQTLEVHFVQEYAHPPRKARHGDPQPQFLGTNLKHSQWIRQLRRVDNYVKMVRKLPDVAINVEHQSHLWHKILQSPGFAPCFALWWQSIHVAQLPLLPDWPPDASMATVVQLTLEFHLRQFEQQLMKTRISDAKTRRTDDPNVIFKDLQGPKTEPVQMLLDSKYSTVTQVDSADSAVEVSPPRDWQNAPLRVGKTCQEPIHVEPDKLWLPSTDAIQPGDVVQQHVPIGTYPEIFHAFSEEWKQRWDRHRFVDDSRWDEIIDFATMVLPRLPEMQYGRITYEEWIAAVRKKPARAAVGPDSISRQDLLNMPRDLAEALLDLLFEVESTGSWPAQLCEGFIIALEKQPGASTPDQFRPITVFALPYRVWSSIRATQALRHLEPIVPHTCTGNVPGRSAGQQWLGILDEMETATTMGFSLSGAVLDLVKAFNTLPRLPLLRVLQHLNVPTPVLKAWGSNLTKMSRRFRVNMAVGPPNRSTTGFAEGCALSCLAMLASNLVCHAWTQLRCPSIRTWSYVDNLEITALDQSSLEHGLSELHSFCTAMDITIDQKKTFTWTRDNEQRKDMRTKKMPTKLHDRDLGAHMQYCKLVTNYTVTAKCKQMGPLWNRLARSLAPYSQKLRAIRVKAWPSCLHAILAVHMADRHFSTLRTGAVKALMEHKRGTSPIVHLSLVENPLCDPQCFALLSTVLTYRMVGPGKQYFADTMAFLHNTGAGHVQPGPLNVMLNRLQQVAWSWQYGSIFLDEMQVPCDILLCPMQELRQRLTLAWQARVKAEVSTRSTMSGMPFVNPQLTVCDMHRHSPEDRAILRTALNGTFFTADCWYEGKQKMPNVCAFCGQPDSQVHRHWSCPAFASVRTQHHLTADQIAAVMQMPACVSAHGWLPNPPVLDQFRAACVSLPDETTRYACPSELPPILHLFTDGACLAPACPFSRLAAWGVVLAAADFATFHPLASGLVSGWLQTVLRGELSAVISAVEFCVQVQVPCVLWIDNQLVYNRVRRAMQQRCWVKPNQKDADLWRQLYDSLARAGPLVRQVVKVCSHQHVSANEFEHWVFKGNACADSLAASVFLQQLEILPVWRQLRTDLDSLALFRKSLHAVIIDVGRKALVSNSQTQDQFKPPLPPRIQPSQVQEVDIPVMSEEVLPRRYQFAGQRPLLEWMNRIVDRNSEPVIVSWFELNLLFEHQTAEKGVSYDKRRKQWHHATAYPLGDFVKRTNHFSRFIQGSVNALGGSCKAHNLKSFNPCITFWCQSVMMRLSSEDKELIQLLMQQQQPFFRSVGAFRSIS